MTQQDEEKSIGKKLEKIKKEDESINDVIKRIIKRYEKTEKLKRGSVYMILNTKNDKKYIGSSIDFEKRKRSHLSALKREDHHCVDLQKDLINIVRVYLISNCSKGKYRRTKAWKNIIYLKEKQVIYITKKLREKQEKKFYTFSKIQIAH